MQIIPAILPKNIEDIRSSLARVVGLIEWVQLDIADGTFVNSQTWPYNGEDAQQFEEIMAEEQGLPYWDQFNFEFDLMVKDAKDSLATFVTMGASRILFHLEAEQEDELLDFLEGIDPFLRETIEFGIAFCPSTSLEKVYPFIPYIDVVQCMGSDTLGQHGEDLDERIYDILENIHTRYPDIPLQVDIGVNKETAPLLCAAGATQLVSGSMIWSSNNIQELLNTFESL